MSTIVKSQIFQAPDFAYQLGRAIAQFKREETTSEIVQEACTLLGVEGGVFRERVRDGAIDELARLLEVNVECAHP